ncbi:MAG: hypothetical protein J7641_10770 [Cyanobacteria bacterium SID2]|nr:hypothetical protein [Cyanobacteria bacterium SID2]MBP0002239.1 hypothetical protein [Cyanobacteria bacterium SBC]
MDRSKVVAIVTGVISLVLAVAYLLLVQFLDSRPMRPISPDLSSNGFDDAPVAVIVQNANE